MKSGDDYETLAEFDKEMDEIKQTTQQYSRPVSETHKSRILPPKVDTESNLETVRSEVKITFMSKVIGFIKQLSSVVKLMIPKYFPIFIIPLIVQCSIIIAAFRTQKLPNPIFIPTYLVYLASVGIAYSILIYISFGFIIMKPGLFGFVDFFYMVNRKFITYIYMYTIALGVQAISKATNDVFKYLSSIITVACMALLTLTNVS